MQPLVDIEAVLVVMEVLLVAAVDIQEVLEELVDFSPLVAAEEVLTAMAVLVDSDTTAAAVVEEDGTADMSLEVTSAVEAAVDRLTTAVFQVHLLIQIVLQKLV